ncbi:hypothetical protein MTX78_04680 [Hymenobacter tibetensis]|uniref:NERD domain-containing protein n=1 Tax=Hymenobacter tibetensis TaxID=497967 RepID=A0ABY4D049_9BACT|nr:hypothetical protein [Hymenobacter tibetensis]UOG75895.1 hypothetical protein MTX78_04680 [Hymenobacter tibetensis]
MLHTFLSPPFADATRQAQFEAVQAALEAEPAAPVSLLLGNFAVEEGGEVFDALLIRPHSVTVLLFVAGGGQLDILPAAPSTWQLDGQALPVTGGATNPFGQFRRLKEGLADWLVSQLGPGQVAPELITGLALFAAPVTYGPGVEQYLRTQPGADSFQLLHNLAHLTRRLRQLAHPEIQLSNAELTNWAQDLAAEHPEATEVAELSDEEQAAPGEEGYWEQKARQLWRWLGAEDVPHDAPYGSAAAAVAAGNQEKNHLEQLRQQVRQELGQQRQEMEAREAEREASITLLRAQLAQAPAATTDAAALEARLATETREKLALEEAIRASRAEAAARNQELDARIQQLGQLIEQFQGQPAATPAIAVPSAQRPTPRAATKFFHRPSSRLRLSRVALVGAAAVGFGFGIWGLTQVPWGGNDTSEEPARYSSVKEAKQETEETTIGDDTEEPMDSTNQETATLPDSTSNTEEPSPEPAAPTDEQELIRETQEPTHDTIRLGPISSPDADTTS